MLSPENETRLTISVCGVVQGVGFRPFVFNLAQSVGLTGWIQNESDAVRIEVQGDPRSVDAFVNALRNNHPPQAKIESLEIDEITQLDHKETTFRILASDGLSSERSTIRPTIPADLAMCAECRAEIGNPTERRHSYPFTNCTNCGPRWSIIEGLPYDRDMTSMSGFEMCPQCRAEYEDPTDRRFHAQPIACPRCGPELRLIESSGRQISSADRALADGVACVLAGRILALKGLGGFQLLADATNNGAVVRLRQRKGRPDKPFAVMMAALDEVRSYCHVSDDEAQALSSHESPILLLRRRNDVAERLAETVAPDNPYLGVMLTYTPLHQMLMERVGRPIICTSGNLSEEPMAITTDGALKGLGRVADLFLTHNRPIVRPVDDSVARYTEDGLQLLRRARGYAPLPIDIGSDCPTLVAVGGHLKNTVALSLGHQAIVSSHVGDLDNVSSVEVHHRAVLDLVSFFRAKPDAVVCDMHPDYASTRCAERFAAEWDVPVIRVQHHHAHVAACMAEHKLDGPALGLSWDGTGYGTDGTVWGGEALRCEGSKFVRVAQLRTFALPGGDRAVREPRRSALGLLFDLFGHDTDKRAEQWFKRSELDVLLTMLDRSTNCPRTSSMGRLFDAIAVICGLPETISFEGQSAMALEFAADESVTDMYPIPLVQADDTLVADWRPLVRAVLDDRESGVPVGRISGRFHNSLAELAAVVANRCGYTDVVLTGGCFQNALLSKRVRARLLESGRNVYTHRLVPPGDGGIALGQILVAARLLGGDLNVSRSTG